MEIFVNSGWDNDFMGPFANWGEPTSSMVRTLGADGYGFPQAWHP